MKVLLVTSRAPFGRGEAFLYPELRRASDLGVEFRLVPIRPGRTVVHAASRGWVDGAVGGGFTSPRAWLAAGARLRRDRRSFARAMRLVAGHRAGVTLKNWLLVGAAARLADVARSWGADHIHGYWASGPASVAMLGAELAGLDFSFTAHRWDIREANLLPEKVRRAVFVRAISHDGASDLRAAVAAELHPRIRVLHVGVDLPSHMQAPTVSADPAGLDPVLVSPAALVEVKGHEHLISAIRLLKAEGRRVRLVCAGEGPRRGRLERMAREQGVQDRVEFLGQLPHESLMTLYRRPDVLAVAIASTTAGGEKEGIPVALMEAMAHGLPVVATATGGTGELIDGAAAVVPERDPEAIARAVARLLDDPVGREEMARWGAERVRTRFDADVTARTWADWLEAAVRP